MDEELETEELGELEELNKERVLEAVEEEAATATPVEGAVVEEVLEGGVPVEEPPVEATPVEPAPAEEAPKPPKKQKNKDKKPKSGFCTVKRTFSKNKFVEEEAEHKKEDGL